MGNIKRTVINPFEDYDTIEDLKENYHFDLRNDLKNVNLKERDFKRFLDDLYLGINSNKPKGAKITAAGNFSVYKIRLKDENRNIGSSNAYRLLYMYNNQVALPFHLYHKTSGRKPKIDLTPDEKKRVAQMVKDAAKQKKGG